MLSTEGPSDAAPRSQRLRFRFLVAGLAIALLLAGGILAYGGIPGPRDVRVPSTPEVHLTCRAAGPQRPCVFLPEEITVRAGTTVRWTNDEPVFHTITSTDSLEVLRPNGLFDRSVHQEGEAFDFVFVDVGTVFYYCQTHSEFMTGAVVVIA